MTREAMIAKEARSLSLSINTDENTRNSIYDALLTMADYVESHPKNPWRDAKKDPPKREIGNKIYYTFLDISFDGVNEQRYYHFAEYKRYGFGNKGWVDEDGNLVLVEIADYWMPIPELKKGELK